ncbi:hypothetical protein [Nitrosopumilus sp.]|uniref:hypothetical protein n=1 Tax=Nitrosopumilus sp. TaxID=2024843 RepID=UPI00261A121C|nr:hypothetical protein [Nitrosopumilus sp.]
MADPNFSWIYLVIFLAIPLARIIPRLLAKYRGEQPSSDEYTRRFDEFGQPEPVRSFTKKEPSQPLTREKQVLGELHGGVNSFDKLQKNTGFDTPMLNSILEDLEKKGLMKVVEKQGMFGPKVELYSTDKGFKEYYS